MWGQATKYINLALAILVFLHFFAKNYTLYLHNVWVVNLQNS